MPTIASSLERKGLALPTAPAAVANYVPAFAVHSGTTLYVSGQLPIRNGELIATGRVPSDVDTNTAYECAKQCVLNALAVVDDTMGNLDRVRGVARLAGYVNADQGFAQHPQIINGASDLLVELLGEAGKHARAAVGVTSLPLNAPVEIEFTFVID